MPPCAQVPIPCAAPHVGLPTEIREAVGALVPVEVALATHLRRVVRGPGACAQGPSGLGMARLGDPALTPARAPGVVGRGEAESAPEWSGVVNAGEVPARSGADDGDGARHPPQGLEGRDQGAQPPGLYRFVAGWRQALEACGGLGDRPDVRLADALRRGGGPDARGEPVPGGGVPRGPARRPDRRPQPPGVATALGRLELAAGGLAGTTAVTDRVIRHRRDRDGGESTRAPQACSLDRVTPVGRDAMAGWLGEQGRRNDPAAVPAGGEITLAPITARSCLVDEDPRRACRRPLTHARVEVTRSGPARAHRDDCGLVVLGHVCDSAGLILALQTARARARLGHGGPPRAGSGVDRMGLWRLARSPTWATEVRRPMGRHDV